MSKKLKIVISGSFRKEKNFAGIQETIKGLENLGVEVLSPKLSAVVNPGEKFLILKSDTSRDPRILEQQHLAAIKQADLLYLYNLDGYIGASTIFEMGYAVAHNISVVSKEPITDVTLQLFISMVAPTVKELKEILSKNQT